MWLVILGVVLTVLRLAGLGPVGTWPWWAVLSPYFLAVVWWQFADRTGITQREIMRRQDEKAAKRREAAFEALGMRPPKGGQGGRPPEDADWR